MSQSLKDNMVYSGIGTKTFEINSSDFIRGISSSNEIEDGGLSPETEGINLTKTPGLLYFQAATSDNTGSLENDLIASCEDGTPGTGGVNQILVDDGAGGANAKYWSWNGSSLSNLATDASTPNGGYSKGTTQMISFGITSSRANIFTTNGQYITRLQLATNTLTTNFKQFTYNASTTALVAPHPCIVYENNAYYGDGNILLRQTDPTSATMSTVLTLREGQIIISLGIDPGTGRMLISTVEGLNMSNTRDRLSKVLYYDGFSEKPLKSIIVDDMVTAFFPVGATMYIGYGQKLGVWNGAGIQFLRKLNVSLVSTKLPYRDNFTNIDSTLYVIEANKLLAYGPTIAGASNCFYYALVQKDPNDLAAADLTCVFNSGSGILGFGWVDSSAAEKFSTLDTTAVNSVAYSGSVSIYTNKYTFERPITFNQIVVMYGADVPTSNSGVDLYVIDENGVSTQIAVGVQNTQSNMRSMTFPWPNITTRTLQFRYLMAYASGNQTPIERFIVHYNDYD